MTSESTIEVTLPTGAKLKFRPSQSVHIAESARPILAVRLSTGCTILPCCIESQEPHEEPTSRRS